MRNRTLNTLRKFNDDTMSNNALTLLSFPQVGFPMGMMAMCRGSG